MAVVQIEDGSGSDTFVQWAMGLLMVGAAGAIPWLFDEPLNYDMHSPDFNPAIILVAVLAAGGCVFLGQAIVQTLRGRRFGCSVLEIPASGPKMGKPFGGTIRCSLDIQPQGDFVVRLRFIETFHTFERKRGTRNVENVRWEAAQAIPATGASLRDGLAFSFPLPKAEQLEREVDTNSVVKTRALIEYGLPGKHTVYAHNRCPDSVRWILDITAPLQGLDYYASFGVRAESDFAVQGTAGASKRHR